MPITYKPSDPPSAHFAGLCVAEDADALLVWLRENPTAVAHLAEAEAIHTALVQLILAAGTRLPSLPRNPVLAACLAPLHSTAPPPPGKTPPRAKRRPRRPRRAVDSADSALAPEQLQVMP